MNSTLISTFKILKSNHVSLKPISNNNVNEVILAKIKELKKLKERNRKLNQRLNQLSITKSRKYLQLRKYKKVILLWFGDMKDNIELLDKKESRYKQSKHICRDEYNTIQVLLDFQK